MIPTSFKYKRVYSVSDAISALGGDNKILAGGHSLIPALKLRLNEVDALVDISKIEELKKIQMDGDVLCIGSAATHQQIASDDKVQEHAAIFVQVANSIGDVQVRNAGTIGGSIAHADPAADWPAALLAANATITVRGSGSTRTIASSDFFTGMFSTALEDGELITEIRVPSMKGGKASYQKFAQPASRFALVGCAVVSDGGDKRVAYTGLSDTPFLAGNNGAIGDDVYVMSDHYADETYRRHIAGVMLQRALDAIA